MDIDRDLGNPRALEHQERVMNQRTAPDFEDRLRYRFGEWTQALAITGRKNKAPHRGIAGIDVGAKSVMTREVIELLPESRAQIYEVVAVGEHAPRLIDRVWNISGVARLAVAFEPDEAADHLK